MSCTVDASHSRRLLEKRCVDLAVALLMTVGSLCHERCGLQSPPLPEGGPGSLPELLRTL